MPVKRGFREDARKAPSGKIVDRLRVALDRGIDELQRRGRPLHMMIADGFEKDPARMITAIRSILPQEINHGIQDVTAQHLAAVRELSRLHALPSPTEESLPVVIDVEPVKVNHNGREVSTDNRVLSEVDEPSNNPGQLR